MEEKITVNSTEFTGYALLSGDLFLYMFGSTMPAVFNSLYGNSGCIVYTQANGNTISYPGFSKLVAIRDEGNDLVTAVMRKEG